MKLKNQMCAIYDDDDDNFRVGEVVFYNDIDAIFKTYTTRGYEDGLYMTKIDSIYRVDYNNKYIEKIKKLFASIEQNTCCYKFDFDGLDLSHELLEYSKQESYVITIKMSNEDVISGEVYNIDDQYVYLNVINDDGESDGESIIKKDCIERIWCNTGYERNLQLLKSL